jgi:uncharacterized membrane protein
MATVTQEPRIAAQTPEERRAAELVGQVLRISVALAAALVLLGLVLVALDPAGVGRPSLDDSLGRSGHLDSVSPRTIYNGIRDGNGESVILLGLLVLVISPSVRVGITLLVFLRERRRELAVLAGIVLVILLLGLVGIGA